MGLLAGRRNKKTKVLSSLFAHKRMGVFPSFFFDIITVMKWWIGWACCSIWQNSRPSAAFILYLNLHPDEHILVLLLELWLFMNDLADIIATGVYPAQVRAWWKCSPELKFLCKGRASKQQHNSCCGNIRFKWGVHWEYDGRDRVAWKSIFLFGNLLVSYGVTAEMSEKKDCNIVSYLWSSESEFVFFTFSFDVVRAISSSCRSGKV